MKKSLTVRINILMIIVVTLFFTIFGSLDYMYKSKKKTKELYADLLNVTNRLSQTVNSPLWNMNFSGLKNILESEMQNKNITSIFIFNNMSNDFVVGKARDREWSIVDLSKNLTDIELQETSKILFENNTIAKITVQCSDQFIKQELIKEALTQVKMMILLIITFITVISISIFIVVIKPVKVLSISVRAIKDGNIDEPIKLNRDDELGYLANDISIMRDTIKQKIDTLNKEIIEREKIEKELKVSEENLSTTLNSIGDAVIATDINGKIIRMNPVAEKLTGMKLNEARELPFSEAFNIINSHSRDHAENPVKKVITTGEMIELTHHTILISKDGVEYQIADTAAPIKDNFGKITGVVLVFRDVTEEYRMQEALISEKNYAQNIIRNAPSLICGIDVSGTTTFINPFIEKITGYNEKELIGNNYWEKFYPGEEMRQVEKLFEDFKDGEVVDYEMILTCKNNESKNIIWNS